MGTLAPCDLKVYIFFKNSSRITQNFSLFQNFSKIPKKLLSQFHGRWRRVFFGATYFTNVFNGDITGGFKILDLLSGIRTVEVDVARQAGFTDRRKREELGDLLRRNGILSEFNKLFIPKK